MTADFHHLLCLLLYSVKDRVEHWPETWGPNPLRCDFVGDQDLDGVIFGFF